MTVTVIGAGLAGSEAAWQLAQRGVEVTLKEMRPRVMTPAHRTASFAELVCSNSLRGASLANAVGLLKEEMRRMGSLVMDCADRHRIPAGGALAVDREGFSKAVTARLEQHPLVTVDREEVGTLPPGPVIIATGPLTSPNMADAIQRLTGEEYLYFYDAAAPIIEADSINFGKVFRASRYNKGDADYLNCPMSQEQYQLFYHELITAVTAPLAQFEEEQFFEGCMPVEAMAKRGFDTLLFGPLKPVGLADPVSGRQPYAVVQLRMDNREGTLYNMVGFQTHLKWPEQKRVFRLIPGLEQAQFARFGVMHRNTFINSPRVLEASMQARFNPEIFFAGQITGVEGYVESAVSGLVAGINAARLIHNKQPLAFPAETATGALCRYVATANHRSFQPMNVNFGLLPALNRQVKPKAKRNEMLAERALSILEQFLSAHGLLPEP